MKDVFRCHIIIEASSDGDVQQQEDLLSRTDLINEQFLNRFVIVATHYLVQGLARDRRLRSSSKAMITRRQTGLIDSLSSDLLFYSSNRNKRQRRQSANSSSK
ncbi:unnamed protein product [Rotaria sordida]|uniref:Uncharacterized protein n=1 Tax=Rotaria sordida TaxID=392033 RepID=A0A814PV42_9BILA|nr:unnamed protein product [Rotaria sordida]